MAVAKVFVLPLLSLLQTGHPTTFEISSPTAEPCVLPDSHPRTFPHPSAVANPRPPEQMRRYSRNEHGNGRYPWWAFYCWSTWYIGRYHRRYEANFERRRRRCGWTVVGGSLTIDCMFVCPLPYIRSGLHRGHKTHIEMENFAPLAWGTSECIGPLFHRRRGAGSKSTHPHARTGRTVFFIHYRIHLAPTRAFTGTTTSRWTRSDVWVGGGSSYGSGEGQGRKSGSEFHFAYDKVERLGAWNSGWQIVIGVGYGICIK